MPPMDLPPICHGGADGHGPLRHDFSCNSHGLGPCPEALAAVQNADPSAYPDPDYLALRQAIGRFYGIEAERVVIGASGSELMQRLSYAVARRSSHTATPTQVHMPPHAYGDYARAAHIAGLRPTPHAEAADLIWLCEPSSPLGQAEVSTHWPHLQPQQMAVLDCAYAPLRLEGHSPFPPPASSPLWQLHTPNKALGLTGVRGAYLLAPSGAEAQAEQLRRMAASWPLGAHGLAMLEAWLRPSVQSWLAHSLPALRQLKAEQTALCQSWGWQVQPSVAHFFCARPNVPPAELPAYLQHLRGHGIKLRDCASFGLPHTLRLNSLPAVAQNALASAHLLYLPLTGGAGAGQETTPQTLSPVPTGC